MQTCTTRRLVSLALAAMLAMGSIATSFADGGGGPASGEVQAGTTGLAETDGGTFSFASTHVTATDTTATMDINTNVTDLRGTGSGWILNLTVSQFTCTTSSSPNSCASTEMLPTTGILNSVPSCATNSTCQLPSYWGTYCSTAATNHPIDNTAAPFTLCASQTNSGTGMGSIDIASTLDITIPSDAYKGTYTSTVTIAFES